MMEALKKVVKLAVEFSCKYPEMSKEIMRDVLTLNSLSKREKRMMYLLRKRRNRFGW